MSSSPANPIALRVGPSPSLWRLSAIALAASWAVFVLLLYVSSFRAEAWGLLGVVLLASTTYFAWHWPFATVLALVAVLPFQPLPTMIAQAVDVPHIHMISGVKEGLFLIAIVSGLSHRRIKLQTVDYILVALILMTIVSRLFGGYWMGIKDDWEFALPFFAGRLFPIPSKYELRWVKIVLASMSIVAVLGILEYLFVPLELRILWLGLTKAPEYYSAAGYSGERIGSTLAGPTEFGNCCALAFIFYWAYKSHLRRWWMAGAACIGIGLFLSVTRGAWLAAALGVALLEVRTGRSVRLVVGVLAGACLFLALLPVLGLKGYYKETTSLQDPSLQGHLETARASVDAALDHPLGTGPGTAGPRAVERDPNAIGIEGSFLTISVEYGIFAGVLFVLFCLLCLKGCLDNPSRLGLAAASVLLGYLSMLAITPAHQSLATAALALFPAGAALNKKVRISKPLPVKR